MPNPVSPPVLTPFQTNLPTYLKVFGGGIAALALWVQQNVANNPAFTDALGDLTWLPAILTALAGFALAFTGKKVGDDNHDKLQQEVDNAKLDAAAAEILPAIPPAGVDEVRAAAGEAMIKAMRLNRSADATLLFEVYSKIGDTKAQPKAGGAA